MDDAEVKRLREEQVEWAKTVGEADETKEKMDTGREEDLRVKRYLMAPVEIPRILLWLVTFSLTVSAASAVIHWVAFFGSLTTRGYLK